MRNGFTLVELLVVTLVIAILASIVFRLSGVTKNTDKMQTTIQRMQRLENCLSGYYAAFGSYPPVEVHGSRNPFYPINDYHIQQTERSDPEYGVLDWNRVKAACKSQPVAMAMPYNNATGRPKAAEVSEQIRMLIATDSAYAGYADTILNIPFDGLSPGAIRGKQDKSDWAQMQLFKFGLMSFLLPRYLTMLGGDQGEDDLDYYDFAQWGSKNNRPCRFRDGLQYPSWKDVNTAVQRGNDDYWEVAVIPSQAVCQRWIANLDGVCRCGNFESRDDVCEWMVYGVNIKGTDGAGDASSPAHLMEKIFSCGDSQTGEHASGTQQYMLNEITVCDEYYDPEGKGSKWNNELYYYSPPPYQSYRLWSGGPNGYTFPPWITDEQIRTDPNLQQHAKKIYEWISDDIVHLSH